MNIAVVDDEEIIRQQIHEIVEMDIEKGIHAIKSAIHAIGIR